MSKGIKPMTKAAKYSKKFKGNSPCLYDNIPLDTIQLERAKPSIIAFNAEYERLRERDKIPDNAQKHGITFYSITDKNGVNEPC